MNVKVTRIVLPRLGPMCAECFSRGHIAAFPVAPGEVHSFGTEPQAQLDGPAITDPEPRGFMNSATEPDVA